MKRLVSVLTAITAAIVCSVSASAITYSDLAVGEYAQANIAGRLSYELARGISSERVTRLELSKAAYKLFKEVSGVSDDDINIVEVPFDDCDDPSAVAAYSLGLIWSQTETNFDPTGPVTREEFSRVVIETVRKAGVMLNLDVDDMVDVLAYDDFEKAAKWTNTELAFSIKYGVMSGKDGLIRPLDYMTREECVTSLNRAYDVFGQTPESYAAPKINTINSGYKISDGAYVGWEGVEGASGYNVFVNDITGNVVYDVSTAAKSVFVPANGYVDGESYNITVAAVYPGDVAVCSDSVSVEYKKPKYSGRESSAATLSAKESKIFGSDGYYRTEEQAKANMKVVTVPVWRLASDGSKYSSKASFSVHKNLAEEVVCIFTEIYNDPSQFPIKDLGGFCWRNTLGGVISQHSYGTCIDINSNENFYISAVGTVLAGRTWSPTDNPYSIDANGIVVRTFEKYGWLWGGDSWGEGYAKDYMHFTYLGK